jgi:NADPH:quinone reductase-like Zn-dependent oxidoreductase
MLVMAIEASKQLADSTRTINGYTLKDCLFHRPLNIPQDAYGVETHLTLRASQDIQESSNIWSEFSLYAFENDQWVECCHGFVRVEYELKHNEVDGGRESAEELRLSQEAEHGLELRCKQQFDPKVLYDGLNFSGFGFGPSFQPILRGSYSANESKADIKLFEWPEDQHPQPHAIHPTTLDGMLHLAIAGYAEGGQKDVPTMIPTMLRNLWVSGTGASHSSPDSHSVKAGTWLVASDNRGYEFDGSALTSSGDAIVARFNGLKLTIVADAKSSQEDTHANRQVCYNVEYRPDPQLIKGPILPRSQTSSFPSLTRFVDMIAHKSPGLKILECGEDRAENTSMTEFLVGLLTMAGADQERINPRYSLYHYASGAQDVSDVTSELIAGLPSLTLTTLDSLATNNNKMATAYDVILANNVLDSSSNGDSLLGELPNLLTEGGCIILNESTVSNLELLQSSFQILGYEILCEDLSTISGIQHLVLVARKQNVQVEDIAKMRIFAVVDPESMLQINVSENLRGVLKSDFGLDVTTVSLQDAVRLDNKNDAVFIVLLELDHPFTYELSEETYPDLHTLIIQAKDILWVNPYGGSAPGKPEFAIINGISRAIRNEYEDHAFTVLQLDSDDDVSARQIQLITAVLHTNHLSKSPRGEPEYIEINDELNIGRVTPNPALSQDIFTRSLERKTQVRKMKDSPPLVLTIGSPGLLDTLHFVEDKSALQPLGSDEIEIEIRSVGMNFKDLLIALGQVPGQTFGLECAGVVSRCGDQSDLILGDRVVMAGPFGTLARGKSSAACKIPNSLSFAEAASIPGQFGTAWQVVHRIARLGKGETILIHAAAGGTGQAAIQIAQYLGATVLATVGSSVKKRLLMNEYNIPEEHIFYSRDTGFAKGVMRVTGGRGVDVVINSLSGDSLIASWQCIAPYGRFVEIGKRDILSNSRLPMLPFRHNISFIGFDASTWYKEKAGESTRDLQLLVDLFANKTFHAAKPLQVYSISQVEDVFRLMQDGKTAGKLILDINPDAEVMVGT